MYVLPDIGAGSFPFWWDALHESGKHGARMLAALVRATPDNIWAGQARKDRDALLIYLENLPTS